MEIDVHTQPLNTSFPNFFLSYLFMAVLGLCCCVGFSLVAVSWVYTLVIVHGLLVAVVSLVAELGAHGLGSCGSWALERRFSSCGAWA